MLLRGRALANRWIASRGPNGALRWYRHRYAMGGARLRRIGIVAVARKLFIALWRYLETGRVPAGALLKT